MDPVSALGLAGTVVQFTQVAYTVLKNSKSIYNSATGQSQNSEALEVICQKFLDFSEDYRDDSLGKSAQQQSEDRKLDAGTISQSRSQAMKDLTLKCNQDCRRLLEIVEASKVKGGKNSRWFRSIKPALKEAFKTGEIEELRERIATYQTQIILELCKSSSNELDAVGKQLLQLDAITRDLRRHGVHSANELSTSMKRIQDQVADLKFTAESKDGLELSMNDVNVLTEKVTLLSRDSQKRANEYAILSQINYTQRPTRHDGICEAHEGTFRWMFDPVPERQALYSGISQWLSTGSGAFWVAGKPGSGKSTFMKYIADHGQTRRRLDTWAGDKPLIMAAHYFWSAGNPIQKSHEGLLRSLLLDIFCQMPELLPDICTERWRCITGEEVNHYYESTMPWTLPELQKAMRRIATKKCLPARICFFIDGLDEYGGDDDVLCKLIKELCRSSDMKACVASRTENIFEAYFGSDLNSRLYIQDLTREDIQIYVETTLSGLSERKLSNFRTGDISRLAKEITDRAQGVFLWVSLVTKLLIKGITNCDTLTDLRRSLESIPPDLQNLYWQLIDTVDPYYEKKMAETLLIACTTVANLRHPIFYMFQEKEHENESYAIDEDLEVWDDEKISGEIDKYKCRLNSTCNGLLEIRSGYICFLHRTVYEYLQKDEVKDSLRCKAREKFNVSFCLFQAWVAVLKHCPVRCSDPDVPMVRTFLGEFENKMCPALRTAQHLTPEESSVTGRISVRDLLNDLEFAVRRKAHSRLVYTGCNDIDIMNLTEWIAVVTFRALVIQQCLYKYVKEKIDQDKDYLEGLAMSPLSCTLGILPNLFRYDSGNLREPLPYQLDLLHYLLTVGHNPNKVYDHESAYPILEPKSVQFTPWSDFCERFTDALHQVHCNKDSLRASICYRYNDTFALFLKFDADPNAQCLGIPIWAQFMLWVIEMELSISKVTPSNFKDTPDYTTWSNSFLQIIEVVLSTANFEAQAVGLQDMVRDSLKLTRNAAGDPLQTPLFRNEYGDDSFHHSDSSIEEAYKAVTELQAQNRLVSQGLMIQEQARVSMMKLLWLKLHLYRPFRKYDVSDAQNHLRTGHRLDEHRKVEYKTVSLDAGGCYQYGSLIVRAIAKFLNHASLPKPLAQTLEKLVIETFPSSVLKAAATNQEWEFNMIGGTQSAANLEEVDISIPTLV